MNPLIYSQSLRNASSLSMFLIHLNATCKLKQYYHLRSKDEEIELITPEKFLEEAPEHVTKPFKDVSI